MKLAIFEALNTLNQPENLETLRQLIDLKISIMNTFIQVCMIWWVSGTAFCGSILGWIWTKRSELKHAQYLPVLGTVLTVFFLTILMFGSLIICYTIQLEAGLGNLLSQLTPGNNELAFVLEVTIFKFGMVIGSSSFLLMLVVWIIMWAKLHSHPTEPEKPNTTTRPRNNRTIHSTAPAI